MKKFKLITKIDRVNFFSDLFIKYYSTFFNKKEFFFIVENQSYEIIEKYLLENGFDRNQLYKYTHHNYGYGNSVSLQNDLQKFFINDNFIVIYVDIDEFLFSENIKKFILNSKENYICPKGYCIIQDTDENFLDKKINFIEQRKKCFIDVEWYSKVCILKSKFEWIPGRHNKNWYTKICDEVLLLDIGKICKKIMIENNKITKEKYKNSIERYIIDNLEDIEKFYQNFNNKNLINIPELIIKQKKYLTL